MIQGDLTRKKAAILGYLHSDGFSRNTKKSSGSLRYEVGFVNKNPDLIRHFEFLIGDVYPFYKPKKSLLKTGCQVVMIYNKEIFKDLIKYGETSTRKWSPPNIDLLTKRTAREYIRTLLYGDGSVSENARRIFIESQSLNGLKGLKEILFHFFNVNSRIRGREDRDIYILEIESLIDKWLFYEQIGLPHSFKKQRRLELGLDKTKKMRNWYIPNKLEVNMELSFLNFFFSKVGVFDIKKARIYLKSIKRNRLIDLQNLLSKYRIRKTKIVGPTKHNNHFILMI